MMLLKTTVSEAKCLISSGPMQTKERSPCSGPLEREQLCVGLVVVVEKVKT